MFVGCFIAGSSFLLAGCNTSYSQEENNQENGENNEDNKGENEEIDEDLDNEEDNNGNGSANNDSESGDNPDDDEITEAFSNMTINISVYTMNTSGEYVNSIEGGELSIFVLDVGDKDDYYSEVIVNKANGSLRNKKDWANNDPWAKGWYAGIRNVYPASGFAYKSCESTSGDTLLTGKIEENNDRVFTPKVYVKKTCGIWDTVSTSMKVKFERKKYKLTFDAQGGECTEESKTIYYGAKYNSGGSLPQPFKTGYKFDGWYTAKSGGNMVTDSTTMGSSATTIYAHWTPIVYTFALDNNYGTTKQTVTFDGDMTKWTKYQNYSGITTSYNSTSKTNTFKIKTGGGWEVIGIPITVTKNTTYSINFNYTISTAYDQYQKYPGLIFQVLSGSPASGANYSLSVSTIYLPRTKTSGSATVMFNSGNYTKLYFCLNAGSVKDDLNLTFTFSNYTMYKHTGTSIYLKYASGWYSDNSASNSITSVSVPTRSYYNFSGYYSKSDGTGTKVTDSSGKISSGNTAFTQGMPLYADWDGKVYKITLDKQNGTGGTDTIYEKYYSGWYSNSSATTSITNVSIPTREGYNFAGYYTATSGGTQIITASGTISSSNYYFTSDTTIYARWNPQIFTITLDKQGGSGGTDKIYLKYNTGWYSNSGATSSITTITKPTKTGYTFSGYYTGTSGGGTQIINSSGSIVGSKTYVAENDTLYAQWTANTYVVNFDTANEILYPYAKSQAGTQGTYTTKIENNVLVYEYKVTTAGLYGPHAGGADLTIGQQYKWSVDIKCSRARTINSVGHEMGGKKSINVTTSWQTFTHTFTASENANGYHAFVFYDYNTQWQVGDVISFKNISVQKVSGMKADNAIGNLTVTYDGTYASLPTPTRTGYTFAGWYLDSGLTKQVTTSTKVTTAGNHTLYSKWTPNKYQVDVNTHLNNTHVVNLASMQFDVKVNGVVAGTNLHDYNTKLDYGSTVEIYNVRVDAGYTYQSYTVSSGTTELSGSSKTNIKISVPAVKATIALHSVSNIYTLTLDRQSGSGGTASVYMKYAVGFYSNSGATTSIASITIPTRAGFTFQGYYTEKEGKDKQIIDKSGKIVGVNNYITANDTLYAYWTANNPAYYDEEGGYWYVEMGMFPQTLETNSTIITALNNGSNNIKTYRIGGETLITRSYNGTDYAQYEGNWYKVEPVRWRLQGTYTEGQGFGSANVTAVLADIVYASAWADVTISLNQGYPTSIIKNDDFYQDSGLVTYSSGATDFIKNTTKKVNRFTPTGTIEIDYSGDYHASSIEEIEVVCGKNANMEMSDLVKAVTNNGFKYWTRDLGTNLNTAKCMTTMGMVNQSTMQNVLGVQYTIVVTEFGCIKN